MHIAFVDSTKAYDTVNQNFSTISQPMKFIRIIKEQLWRPHKTLLGTRAVLYRVANQLPYYLWLAYKKIEHTCSIAVPFRTHIDLFDLHPIFLLKWMSFRWYFLQARRKCELPFRVSAQPQILQVFVNYLNKWSFMNAASNEKRTQSERNVCMYICM